MAAHPQVSTLQLPIESSCVSALEREGEIDCVLELVSA